MKHQWKQHNFAIINEAIAFIQLRFMLFAGVLKNSD